MDTLIDDLIDSRPAAKPAARTRVDAEPAATRVRVPILMLNGDQDFIFPLQTTQKPLFDGLGTPAADKKHILYPGGHEIAGTKRNQIVLEVVAWLDKYLGRVE